jgi:hypothetical protein
MMVWSRWMPRLGMDPGNPRVLEFEYNTYLGLLPLLGTLLLPLMLLSIWRTFQSPKFKTKKLLEDQVHKSQKRALGLLLLLTLAGWCMATFFPFSLAGENLTEAIPALRQFRILARFAWLPYYAWTLAFAAWIGQMLSNTSQGHAAHAAGLRVGQAGWKRPFRTLLGKPIPKALVLRASLALAGVWAVDAYFHTQPVFALIKHPIDGVYLNTEEDYPAWLERCGHRASDFQAILALPYFHIGSEQFLIQGTNQIKNAAFSASVQTGLPLLNVDMSRTSYHQTMTQLQLLNRDGPCSRAHLPDERPLLLLSHPRQMDEHSRRLLARSDRLGTIGALSLHILPLERLDPAFQEQHAQPTAAKQGIRSNGPKISSRAYQAFAWHFVRANLKVPDTDSAGVDHVPAPDSNAFILSFWMRDRLDLPHMPSLIVEGFNASGERLWQRTPPSKPSSLGDSLRRSLDPN